MQERIKMVRAMDTIIRNLNDEDYIIPWLICGVADGDITDNTTDEELEYYCENDIFSELMELFLKIIKNATKDGVKATLYCDGIKS